MNRMRLRQHIPSCGNDAVHYSYLHMAILNLTVHDYSAHASCQPSPESEREERGLTQAVSTMRLRELEWEHYPKIGGPLPSARLHHSGIPVPHQLQQAEAGMGYRAATASGLVRVRLEAMFPQPVDTQLNPHSSGFGEGEWRWPALMRLTRICPGEVDSKQSWLPWWFDSSAMPAESINDAPQPGSQLCQSHSLRQPITCKMNCAHRIAHRSDATRIEGDPKSVRLQTESTKELDVREGA